MSASEDRLRNLLILGPGGDSSAYHAFLTQLGARLRGFLRGRLSRLPDEVEDIVQEVEFHKRRPPCD